MPTNSAKILKQTKSQNSSTDTKLLTCLFATHHAQQLKARPDPADCILYCASAKKNTERQSQEPPPGTPAHCMRPLYRPLYRRRSLARFLGASGKGRFAGFPHGIPVPSTGASSPLSHPPQCLAHLEFRISLDNASRYFRVLSLETYRYKDGVQVSTPNINSEHGKKSIFSSATGLQELF